MKFFSNGIHVGDRVALCGYEGSSVGHNGILCTVKSYDSRYGFYCVSVYGSYHGFNKPEHLKLQISYKNETQS